MKQLLLLLLTIVPNLSFGQSIVLDNNIYYLIRHDNHYYDEYNVMIYAEVIGLENNYVEEVVIPETIDDVPVISIGKRAFYQSQINSITIPSSIVRIEDDAFYDCWLSSIYISDVGAWCCIKYGNGSSHPNGQLYLNGVEIKHLDIPDGVVSIADNSFYGCNSLTSVYIPESVTTIGNNAFQMCRNLESVSFPNSLETIGECAFWGCSKLTTIDIPKSVTAIGRIAFYRCSSLTEINVEEGNPIYDCRNNCNAIIETNTNRLVFGCANTTIPNSVTCIGEGAFGFCSGLRSIIIPDGVKSVEGFAFQSCTNLESITIPPSLTYFGGDVFIQCDQLESVHISDLMAWCNIEYKQFSKSQNPLYYAHHLYLNGNELTQVTIPKEITKINKFAFQGCNLSSVKIPNTITSIGDFAFDRCNSLVNVSVENETPLDINFNTFSNRENITLYVPTSSIAAYKAANYWKDFNVIGSPIEFTDDAVESLCITNWDADENGNLNKDEANTITDLGTVFANNTDITSFDELQYFTGLTSIGEQAFYYCSNLKSIIIPENVTTIGNRAFYVCSGLKSLRIPANVSSIEDRAFAYCSGLETIEVDENNQYYDSRNSCNALIQTSSNTLLVGCKNTVIPDGVTSIAEGAFRGCTELTKIVIPEGVKTIGASAFRGCTGLTSVSLPSTITSIGNYAFSAFDEVYNLTTVSVGMTSPVAIASEVFPNRANSILYVPKGSRPAYKAANYWKEFKQIIELEDGVPVKCEKPTITFFASGKIKVESATEGAKCITNITASNVEPLTDGEISLNTPLTIYTVKAYATAEGYADSDEATATFRYEKTNGDMNGDGTVNIADVVQLVNMILGN